MARGQGKPVSGPGKLSQRTDKQPTRVPTGGDYGAAQNLEAQQQGAAMAAGPAGAPPPAGGGGGPIPAAPPPGGVFGPTGRPNEAATTGAGTRSQALVEDVDGFLRVLYTQFPHPAIGQLISKGNPQG